MSRETASLFVYGSLIDASFRDRLLGRSVETIAARLAGYERRRGRYFYIVRRKNREVAGLVLLDLRDSDLAALDAYEEVPMLYTRERTEVIDAAGRTIRCWLYVPTSRLTTE